MKKYNKRNISLKAKDINQNIQRQIFPLAQNRSRYNV